MSQEQTVAKRQTELDRPIRVVVFGGGPTMEDGMRRFLCRLEAESGIDFLAAFCQSDGQSTRHVFRDLWRRRRFMAFPLVLLLGVRKTDSFIRSPRAELRLGRMVARLADRIFFEPDIHAPHVLARVQALEPDLGLIYGSPILKPQLFELPRFGTLGIHHGQLPQYRGKKTTFWAMYNGEEVAGVSIQKVNAGLDTGEIVKEGCVKIGRRSQRSVWRELEQLGLDLYLEAILDVKAGTVSFRPQTGDKGRLYRDPSAADLLKFWAKQLKRRT